MTERGLTELLARAVDAAGRDEVANALTALVERQTAIDTLTLIANAGVHTIPEPYLRGEVFEVSRGNWTANTSDEVHEELTHLLTGLAAKLRSRPWKQVFLVPTGHPILTLNVKLLVYRLLRINTIDLYYKSGTYIDVHIDHRRISLASEEIGSTTRQ